MLSFIKVVQVNYTTFFINKNKQKIIIEVKVMDQKFWDKIDGFGQNGEYDKIVREIKKLPADKMDMELINVLGRAYMYLGDLGNALD